MTPSGVLFDVDGTLVDNSYLHTLAWARAFAEIGEHPSMAPMHRLVGMGSQLFMEEVIGRSEPELSHAHSRHIDALVGDMHAFPGAGDLLRAVGARGLLVVLATSAKPEELEARLEMIDAEEAIDHVTCSGDADEAKPAPDIFQVAMEAVDLTPERTIVVGDSVWDVRAATAAGVRTIAVEAGGFSEAELREAGAVAVYRDVGQLLERLDESIIADLPTG